MAAAKNFISEDDIEQALLQRLQHLCGFDALNCFTAQPDDLNDGSGRSDKREVILADRVRAALERLNPQAPAHAVDQALAQLLQPRTAMSLVAANREMDGLIRDGVPVTYKPDARAASRADGDRAAERDRLRRARPARRPQPLPGGEPAVGARRAWLPPAGRAAVRERPAAGVHRAEEQQSSSCAPPSTTTSPPTRPRSRSCSPPMRCAC